MSIFGNILGSAISVAGQIHTQRQEQRFQREIQQEQNEYNEKQLAEQRLYNDPSSQMHRLVNAGLTPAGAASVLGAGNQESGLTSSSLPAVNSIAPSVGASIMQGVTNATSQFYQNEMLKAQTEKVKAETEIIPKVTDQTIKESEARIEKMAKDNQLTEQQTEQLKKLMPYLEGRTKLELDELEAKIKMLEQQTKGMEYDNKKKEYENYFREEFGFNPSDGWQAALVHGLLDGKLLGGLYGMIQELKNGLNPFK